MLIALSGLTILLFFSVLNPDNALENLLRF